jgi:RNA-directed DNA polymerase
VESHRTPQNDPRPRRRQVNFCVQGVVSPLLANIYLHHVLDEWFKRDVRVRLKGNSILVRYADDSVMAFEILDDAKRVMDVLGTG